MPVAVKINVALREQNYQKVGSERVKCRIAAMTKLGKMHCEVGILIIGEQVRPR